MRLYHPEDSSTRAAAALRWGAAGLLVVALHAGLGWWIVQPVVSQPPDTVRGIPIDLEPVATPTDAAEPTTTTAGGAAPVPQVATAPASPQPTSEAPPPPAPSPTSPETTAAAEPPTPEPPPPPKEEPPPEPPLPTPEPQPATEQAQVPPPPAVAPPPEPAPVALPQKDTTSDAVVAAPPPPKRPPAPDPRAAAREAARRKAEAEKRAQQRAVKAEARAQAQAAARVRAAQVREAGGPGPAEAAPSGASSGVAVATWRGAVQAHLRAFTPAGIGASGTARVSFSVDRSGRVVAASLAGSSGDAGIDSAAVAMVRRASPVPAPPPELGSRVSLSVPVHFQ